MDTMVKHRHSLSKNQKWVIASTSSGFALENMDVLFLSFAMSSMIADLHLSGGAAGFISTITNLGMLVGGIALIAENFHKEQIGKMTSVAAIGGQIGAILAALIAAWIIPTAGWHMLFLVGIIPVVLTIFIRKHVHESEQFLEAKASEKNSLLSDVAKKMFSTPRLAWQTLGLMIMMTVQIAGYFGLMNWLPTIVQKQLNLNVSNSSLWMIATIIGMSIGMMTFGSIFDYFGPRRAFAIFLIGSALMVYTLSLAQNMATLLVIGAVVGFFSNGMFGGYGAVISRLYPTEIRSSANNIIVNVGRAIGGFSSVVIGILMDRYNLGVVMGFLSALYIISFIVMITLPGLKDLSKVTK
ncbi:MFS transporter [Lactobacillus paragasseri]